MGGFEGRNGITDRLPASAWERALEVRVSMNQRVRGHAYNEEDTAGAVSLENSFEEVEGGGLRSESKRGGEMKFAVRLACQGLVG